MKNGDIASAVVGSVFFAVPYLAFSLAIAPSLAIGATAFCAGELVFRTNEKNKTIRRTKSISKILKEAREKNEHIRRMRKNIESKNIRENLTEITSCVEKIINKIEKEPNKIKNIDNFFDYYLPITVKIVDRYDDIENQNLSSKDSKKLISDTDKMITKINVAYKNILDKLYQSEIIDTDVEMKVFDTMLKSDGFNTDGISISSKEEQDG